MTIAVRERSFAEVFDLGMAVAWKHAGNLLLLLGIGVAPWLALNCWLIRDDDAMQFGWLYPWFLLLCAEAPLATAPLTAYLGEAMFDPRPRPLVALRASLRRTPALLLSALLRGLAAIVVVPLLFMPVHAVEVLLLERQGGGASWKRSLALAASWRGEAIAHLMVGLLVVTGGTLAVLLGGTLMVQTLLWSVTGEWDGLDLLNPATSWWLQAAVWPFIGFLAVVRFLSYLDLRTRREGWEVELSLRRAARRVTGVG